MPRKPDWKRAVDDGSEALKSISIGKRKAANYLPKAVDWACGALDDAKATIWQKMQAAQYLLAVAKWLDDTSNNESSIVTIVFRGHKPLIGEASEDQELENDAVLGVS
jgi:hypothetical protein